MTEISAELYVPMPCVLYRGIRVGDRRPTPATGQRRRTANIGGPIPADQTRSTKPGEPGGGTKPGISQPESRSHYLDRPSAAPNPANFRGPRGPQDARPDPPKSEASQGKTKTVGRTKTAHMPQTRV